MTRFLRATDFAPGQSWTLLDWCRAHGADEITFKLLGLEGHSSPFTDRVEEELAPLRLPPAPRRHLNVYEGEDEVRPTHLWVLGDGSVAVLRRYFADGLFTYPLGEWETGCIEDLIIYRGGRLLLGIVSHEGEGMLYVTPAEAADLKARGIPTRDQPLWI